jgi:hypothetical protein
VFCKSVALIDPRYNAEMPLSFTRICTPMVATPTVTRSLTLLLASCILIVPVSSAQQPPPQAGTSQAAAAAPSGSQSDAPSTQPPPPHAFWDRTNILLITGVGVFRGLDYASTRNFQARGREEVLIPDDVVNNSAGFASLEAAGTAASVGLSYWMHRVGHHKIERWISIVHIGITGFGAARNYSLKSEHTAP